MDDELVRLIELLQLEPLSGEGGLYRETYRAHEMIPVDALPERYQKTPKPASSAIYYLLTHAPDSFSALHRLLTDEIYHFYLGDPVEMLMLHPDGAGEWATLGQDVLAGQRVQLVVPAGSWQGSRVRAGGRYALMGTTMAPAFDHADYEHGDREALAEAYPAFAETIRRLTR